MSSSRAILPPPSRQAAHPPLLVPSVQLTNWPLCQERTTAIVMFLIIVGVTTLVQQTTGNLLATLVFGTALMVSSWRLWLPVSYELGPAGLKQTCWRFERLIPWVGFSGYQAQPRGVLLIPRRTYGAKSLFGSLYISCPSQQRDVTTLLDHYLPAAMP